MVTIRSHANAPIEIDANTLGGADLRDLDLHRALLSGRTSEERYFPVLTCVGQTWRGRISPAQTSPAPLCTWRGSPSRRCARRCWLGHGVGGLISGLLTSASPDLTSADVTGADFRSAVLVGARMECLGLAEARLEGAAYDGGTRWPDGFDPAAHGAVSIGGLRR